MYIFLEIFLEEDISEINNSLIDTMYWYLKLGGLDMKESKEKIKSFKAYKRRKKNKNKRGVLLIVLIAAIGIGNLCIYEISSSLKYDVYYLEKDLKKKKNKLEALEVENIGDKSSNKLEEDASSKLDMIYPTEYQKRYIYVDD